MGKLIKQPIGMVLDRMNGRYEEVKCFDLAATSAIFGLVLGWSIAAIFGMEMLTTIVFLVWAIRLVMSIRSRLVKT